MADGQKQKGKKRPQRAKSPPRNVGRAFARLLCAIFALIGAIPLSGGLVLRSEPLQKWAANETSRILRQEIGVEATFSVELSLIPLRLEVTDLSVPSTDGGSPAVHAQMIAVSPRFFSLLAGRIDVGDIELENAQVRLVFEEGEVQNLAYRFSGKETQRPELTRAPFRSFSITNAQLDLNIDGTRIITEEIDVDAFAEKNLTFDVALRTGGANIIGYRDVPLTEDQLDAHALAHPNTPPAKTTPSWDEDRLCELDLRVFLSKKQIVLRRLSLLGALDLDPNSKSKTKCNTPGEGRVDARLTQVIVTPQKDELPLVRGHVNIRGPLALLDRFFPGTDARGWVGFAGDISLGAGGRLPEITGELTGEAMTLSFIKVADKLRADILVTDDTIQVPTMDIAWGNGKGVVTGIKVEPFAPNMPIHIEKVVGEGVDFPGVMQDIGVTDHSWVDWNFGTTTITQLGGTISPFYIDAGFEGHTRDFVQWDRGFDDPARRAMVGIKKAHLKGRFRSHEAALEFYDADLHFGESHLPIELVSIGFYQGPLALRLKKEGGTLNLADVSPIADVSLAGKSHVYIDLKGPALHPQLDGTVSVKDLVIGGFSAGDVEQADIFFEPLYVEFRDVKGHKGAMDYALPSARLSFDGPASVEFTSTVTSQNFLTKEFFSIFHFDEDPRWSDLEAEGTIQAQVRYLLGGPEDTCGGGQLMVSGTSTLGKSALLGETFSGGNVEFIFDWFDMSAGSKGMRVEVPALTFRKGTGSIFSSLAIYPGGFLQGDFMATRVPVSRVNALETFLGQADGYITGVGQLGGRVDALAFNAEVELSTLESAGAKLAPSHFTINLEPEKELASPRALSGNKTTGCGREISTDYTLAEYKKDERQGLFKINGQLFGKQIVFENLEVSRQRKMVLKGNAHLRALNIGTLSAFSGGALLQQQLPQGTLSGALTIKKLHLDDLFSSEAKLQITSANLEQNDLKIALEDRRAALVIQDKKIFTEYLALRASTSRGQSGILDAKMSLDAKRHLQATLELRPTSLDILAAAVPGIEHAEGEMAAKLSLVGPLDSPLLSGAIKIKKGHLELTGLSTPVEDLNVTVALDQSGLHVQEGNAHWGGGSLSLHGEAPLTRGKLGRIDLKLGAKNVALPLNEHTRLKFDGDLNVNIPPLNSSSQELPLVSGEVTILSALYSKPMSATADISALAARGDKTIIESYDETNDHVKIDVLIHSSRPLKVENELVQVGLNIDPAGLRVTGTDQRFGAVGTLELESGGLVFVRRNEFEIQRGLVRFNDPTRLRPEVDLRAITEYRRYDDRGGAAGTSASAQSSSTTPTAGNWRIRLHAYGAPDDLKVDLNSDPALAQDDIFLLLTVGLTRTELDQMQNSGVGSSVALEALGSLSGAESAVTNVVPIDEFRFGSSYSSRTGRTEPTVTIGKRLSRRIRASVTTSLSDSSEVRSNVEYRATKSLSVEGSFDNVGNVASATGGNLGADVRWRIEFE